MRQQIKLPEYDIHPMSIKMISRGHPWITKDKFSAKFNPRDKFIVALNRRKPMALFLHDPRHKLVSARLWAKEGNFRKHIQNFKKDLSARITTAFQKRADEGIHNKRSNIYLVFGEADQLPGLMVTLLGSQVLIQFYSGFWEHYKDQIIRDIITALSEVLDINFTRTNLWIQTRTSGEESSKPAECLDPNISEYKFALKEYGVTYNLHLGRFYDYGLYTDMACIRDYLSNYFENAKSVLNLYCYTGAYSLYAMSKGAEVTSVDLSQTYLDWLELNLDSNPELDATKHHTICDSVTNYLKDRSETFDLILSDPPSSSSDGKKKTNALKEYEKQLPIICERLNAGGTLIIFLNTHGVSRNKFKQKISDIIAEKELPLTVEKTLGTAGDCPQLKGFPEGSYLKGLVIRKND